MYKLDKLSNTVYALKRGRDKIGSVGKSSPDGAFKGAWVANVTYKGRKLQATGGLSDSAFYDIVAQCNRIDLGVAPDDAAGAKAALEKRNAETAAANERYRQESAPLREAFNEVFAKYGIGPVPEPKAKYRKIHI